MSNIQLYNGDCLEVMKDIPDNSVDMVLCDLPYGTTACKWDVVIPFDLLWKEYKRIAKDTAPIVLFGSQPFTTVMIASNIKCFKEELVWIKNKSGSGLHADKRHLKVHENIIVFSMGAYTFNPQKWEVTDKAFLVHRKVFDYGYANNNIYGSVRDMKKEDDGTRFPISVVSYKVPFVPQKKREYTDIDIRYHPTQKPVELLEYLIHTYSNVGDVILDNCMGSGSTGVACVNTNRNFIGIELDEHYFNIAKQRINETEIKTQDKKNIKSLF